MTIVPPKGSSVRCMMGFLGWAIAMPVAWGQESVAPVRDLSVTSLGVRGDLSVATGGQSDLDLLLTERLRWKVLPQLPGETRLWIDGRLVVDTNGTVGLEHSRLTRMATSTQVDRFTLDVGRSPVQYGGPRLVDGLQGQWRLNRSFLAGVWGGYAPDLFSTLPRNRVGGGLFASFSSMGIAASLLTENLFSEGLKDRSAALFQLRFETLPTISVGSRMDVQQDGDSSWRVADGALFARISPNAHWRVDADYHAYSSYRYLETQDLDPTIQRFAQRAEAVGLTTGIPQESPDTTLFQQVSGRLRWRSPQIGESEIGASLLFKVRTAANGIGDYALVAPSVGLYGWAGGRVDTAIDAALRQSGESFSGDAGGTVAFLSQGDADWMVDCSARALFSSAYDGVPGAYLDTFFDWGIGSGWVLSTGAYAALEHDLVVEELSFGGFLFASFGVRPDRVKPAPTAGAVH
jgi:hypothetical protein